MLEIGITGNIGSGKSAVSDYLIKKGYPVIDADALVKRIYENPSYVCKMIETFGEGIRDKNDPNALDKRAIFDIVFGDRANLEKLDKLVGPFFKIEMDREIAKNANEKIVFFDIPLLYEKNYERFMDKVILVYADDAIRFERAAKRDNKTIAQIRSVDSAQLPQDQKRFRADYVLENNTSFENLYAQLEAVLVRIEEWMK